jgi:NAD(P)-dependent dehydrogenase (short-subunit alcohol dehydrogenase family)
MSYLHRVQGRQRRAKMARVALVLGGTRGIGAAISEALLKSEYKVAVAYAGNDAAAKAFQARTGAVAYRWDAGDFEACVAGIRTVEAALGPIDVLANNAGIIRDSALHKMTREEWDAVIRTDLSALFNMCRPVIEGMRARKFGPYRNAGCRTRRSDGKEHTSAHPGGAPRHIGRHRARRALPCSR